MRAPCGLLLLLVLAVPALAGENWPEFRGPRGNGQSDSTDLPLTWSETENIKWKTAIHGKGWSSPVIWGNQVWMTTATEDGKQMSAIAVDKTTGKIIYDILLYENEKPAFCHPTNSYASCTPAIEEGRVYVHFGSYGTACLDTATGKTIWNRRDLPCDHFRGPASSPVIFENLLVVALDGYDLQYVVALDKTTGKTVWKKDRNIEYGTDNGDNKKAYSTASIIDVGGRLQLISPSAAATISYDPRSGEELWRVQHGGMNAAARPLYEHGLVYITAGDGGTSMVAVRPEMNAPIENRIAWSTGKQIPKRGSLLILGELCFMVNDSGVASCMNAKNGELYWSSRLPGAYWASPIYADGRIYACNQQGVTAVFAPKKEFEQLAENQLDDGCNASPAVSGKALYVRTKTHLYRIEK